MKTKINGALIGEILGVLLMLIITIGLPCFAIYKFFSSIYHLLDKLIDKI